MEPVAWLFVIIAGIGAIIAGLVGLVVLIIGWWFIIPLIGAYVGGWLGFFFGLGLVVIIGIIICAIKG